MSNRTWLSLTGAVLVFSYSFAVIYGTIEHGLLALSGFTIFFIYKGVTR